jgi:AcrR family transcriptional regulator
VSDRRAERGQATRERLVAVATELFAARGFEGTSIDAVLQESGASRGSLYHHFAGKDALFDAVLETVEAAIGAEVMLAVADAGGSVASLRAGCLRWMELAGDPVVQKIVLIDAPSVLGWERWRALEEANALGLFKAAMQVAADEGRIPAELADAFAHTVLATVNELALMIARADDQSAAQREAKATVNEMLTRLLGE